MPRGVPKKKVAKKQVRQRPKLKPSPKIEQLDMGLSGLTLQSVDRRSYERHTYDSRGSVLEHLAHVMIVQAETVKMIAGSATAAPSFKNKTVVSKTDG